MNVYRTINEAWYCICRDCLERGRTYTIELGSYEGQQRKQVDDLAFRITCPYERPLAVTHQGIPISDDQSVFDYFINYLLNPEKGDNEQYTYGERIAPYLEPIAERLAKYPSTNQATIEVARPEDTLLPDPPCLRMLSWKVIHQYSRLQLSVFFRSWDAYAALATNLGGLQLLNEMMADWAGLKPGALIGYSDGAHIYDHCWKLFDDSA